MADMRSCRPSSLSFSVNILQFLPNSNIRHATPESQLLSPDNYTICGTVIDTESIVCVVLERLFFLFNPLDPHSWGGSRNAEGLRPSARPCRGSRQEQSEACPCCTDTVSGCKTLGGPRSVVAAQPRHLGWAVPTNRLHLASSQPPAPTFGGIHNEGRGAASLCTPRLRFRIWDSGFVVLGHHGEALPPGHPCATHIRRLPDAAR
jgi:hypothetical protein